MTVTLTRFVNRLNENSKYAEEQLAKFSASIIEDPVYAFTWADKHYTYAAHKNVAEGLLEMVEAGSNLDQIEAYLGREVLRRARHPASSTSKSSNQMAQALLAVMAEYLELISQHRDN